MKLRLTHHLMAALLGVAFTPRLCATPLNSLNFMPLGTLDLSNRTFVIDTDALTISETNGVSTNVLITGVVDDQGGQADSFGPGGAVTNVGPLGIPHVTVFTVDDLALDGTATSPTRFYRLFKP
jgi:hypothetical protein